MSLTFFAKSRAYSWKMSFEGQVLCQRIEIGPWALTIVGKPSVAAPAVAAAAPAKNVRRETARGLLICSLLIESSIGKSGWMWLSRRYSSWNRELLRVNAPRGRSLPASALRVLRRQSPRIVFLYRHEIKPFQGLPHCKSSAA